MNFKNKQHSWHPVSRKKRGKYRRLKPISNKGFTKELLLLMAKTGLMISLTALAGGHPQALLPLARFSRYGLSRLRQLIQRLERQRYLKRQQRGREELISITDLGKQRAAFYHLRICPHPRPRWDGIWRVLLFDVPNEAHICRNFLRREIKKWGFYPIQKSVFVYPYACDEFIKLLGEASGLQKCIIIIETTSLGSWEKKLKHYFSC